MTSLIIVGCALGLYALFWSWYVGFGARVSPELIERVNQASAADSHLSDTQRKNIRHFLENDDGRDFVMVNLLQLKEPRSESRILLNRYSKIFLGSLLKRAGHPLGMFSAAAGKIEYIDVPEADEWTAAFLVRYRSRTDFAYMLLDTLGSEHHADKLAALDKTVAFPAAPWFVLGGPRWIVALVLALSAATLQLIIG